MNVYDQAARFAVKLDAEGFLRWLLTGMDPDMRCHAWLDTQTVPMPGDPDRRCDTVAELVHEGGLAPPWAVVLEAQTRPDPALLDRLLEYLARLRRELRHGPHGRDRYLLGAAVVQLTGAAPAVNLEMVLPGDAGVELRWRVRARALAEEDAAAVLADIEAGRIAACLLPWVPLMRGGAEAAVIETWKRLAEREEDRRRRGAYRVVALIFAELVDGVSPWRESLEGWDVEESALVREWTAHALERGLQQGRQEGRQEGLEISRETLRGALLRSWRLRLTDPPPPEVREAVQAQRDLNELSRWLDAILAAPTEAEGRRAILG